MRFSWNGLSRLLTVGSAGLLALIALIWIPAGLAMPLARDQGIFAWVGQTILRGGLPYVDAWEHKGPAAHFLNAAAIGLFGPTSVGIRIFDFVLLAGTIGGLVVLARRRDPLWGWIAGLLLVLVCGGGGYWHTAQPDGWSALGLLLATALVWHKPGHPLAALFAGALLGLAVMVKPNYGLMGILPVIGYGWRDEQGRRHWRELALCITGGGAVAAAFAAIFLVAGHAREAWDAVVVFNLQSHVEGPALQWRQIGRALWTAVWWSDGNVYTVRLLHLLAIVGVFLLWRSDRRGAALLSCGWFLAWVIGLSQNKGFYYHYVPMYGFAALLAAQAVRSAVRPQTGPRDRLRNALHVGVAASVALLVIVARPLPFAARWWGMALGMLPVPAYEAQFCLPEVSSRDFCHVAVRETAAFLRTNLAPDDGMYVWGYEALLYFEAQRWSPTRFGFNYPMAVGSPDWKASVRREVLAALQSRPPKAIVVQETDKTPITTMTSRQMLSTFPELAALIDSAYRPAHANPDFTVYLRR